MDVIPADRRSKLSLLNFEQIFESEIYLEDLRKVVIKNWNDLGKLFNADREHFQTYMEFVNKYRVHAHAKDISEDDLNVLQIAIKWLQQQIDNYL